MAQTLQAASAVRGVQTQLALLGFADAAVLIVSQLAAPGPMARLTVTEREGGSPVFNITPLLSARPELGWDVCVKHIAQHMYALEQLTAARPLILSLGLKNYEREDVMAVVEFVASAVRGDGTAGEGATVPQQPSNTAAAVASA